MTTKAYIEKANIEYQFKSKTTGTTFDDELEIRKPKAEGDKAFIKRCLRIKKMLGPKPGAKHVLSSQPVIMFTTVSVKPLTEKDALEMLD